MFKNFSLILILTPPNPPQEPPRRVKMSAEPCPPKLSQLSLLLNNLFLTPDYKWGSPMPLNPKGSSSLALVLHQSSSSPPSLTPSPCSSYSSSPSTSSNSLPYLALPPSIPLPPHTQTLLIPYDCFPIIMSFLPAQTLTKLMTVSTDFKNMASNPQLWVTLCKQVYGVQISELRYKRRRRRTGERRRTL